MKEPKKPHFFDFGISGRVPEPRNQLFLSLETPGYLKTKKNSNLFETYYSYNFQNIANPTFCFSEIEGTENPAGPFNQVLKTSDTRSIPSREHEVDVW